MTDILDQIDETLTFYSAGLGEEITVPVESRHEPIEALSIRRGGIRWHADTEIQLHGDELDDYNRREFGLEHPCRIMPIRHCPVSYGDVCGDRPCARHESDDETPWLADLALERT